MYIYIYVYIIYISIYHYLYFKLINVYIYIYIYICILVTLCDGSRREVRSTPHETFTFENITAVFIDLHMLRLVFIVVFQINSQPHASLH